MSDLGRLRETVGEIRRKNLVTQAAALTYYGFVSLFPLALLVLFVGSLTGLETVAEEVVESAGIYLSESGQRILRQLVELETSPTVGVVGVVDGVLVFLNWLYLGFWVLLLGGAVNLTLARS